tara:strand:+ start:892 stop:1299 length:408 start_codon:yes stop_codon:yes gene_type:complete
MKVVGLVGLCIYLMILSTILSFVDSLDKDCDCSQDSSKNFIDNTVPVLALISTLVFALSLTDDKLFRGFLTLIGAIINVPFFIILYRYTNKLRTEKCECSASWKRKFSYLYSLLYIINLSLILVGGLFLAAGVSR